MSEVKRYGICGWGHAMDEEDDGGYVEFADFELSIGREGALQQRVEVLEGLLREARQHHGVMLMSDPPEDAWKYHRMNERIDAALKPAEEDKTDPRVIDALREAGYLRND